MPRINSSIRDRHGRVLFAEPGRGDEQPAGRRAGFRVRDDDDLEHGVSAASADQIAHLPAVGVLFAAFLSYNPVQQLLGGQLSQLPQIRRAQGLSIASAFAIVVCAIGAIAAILTGRTDEEVEGPQTVGAELAGVGGELA